MPIQIEEKEWGVIRITRGLPTWNEDTRLDINSIGAGRYYLDVIDDDNDHTILIVNDEVMEALFLSYMTVKKRREEREQA